MQLPKQGVLILLAVLIFSGPLFAADLNYPYSSFRLKLPPSEDPFPGMGNYYSTLSKGMKSALWNPASLAKLKLSEASISMVSPLDAYNYQKAFKLKEQTGTMEGGGSYGVFYRYPGDISGMTTKEVEIMANSSYATSATGANFTSALKVNDWLSVGFATNNPVELSTALAGDFPVTSKMSSSLYGQKVSDMQIATNGKLTYTFTSGGIVTTYESTKALWSGFLSQEASIPITSLSELRNDINIQSPYMGTLATKLGNFCLGLNMIPIYATANLENNLRVILNPGTSDQFFYVPDFDPNNQNDIAAWINDPDQYSKSDGYKRKTIRLPTGQVIGQSTYRGYYSASTTRMDVGTQYDVTDWFTIGAALENFGGSSLNFKGNGLASYINYRDIDTAEAGSIDKLMDPAGKTTIDLITDRWVTTFEVGSTKLALEPEKNYALPQKTRVGIALKRPFLIAIDYEQNQTPIKYVKTENNQDKEIIVSNLNFLRLGLDLSLIKTGLTFLMKPTITGLSQQNQSTIDKYFKYGAVPVKFDIGGDFNLFGYNIGSAFGINGLSLLNFVQLDTSNIDLNKIVYYNTYVGKDAWQISYLAQVDLLSTAAAYGTKPAPSTGEKKKFEVSDIKYVHTLGVTYRF